MAKFRPSTTCCGVFSLLVGVEAICLLHLIIAVTIIACTSSRDTLKLLGISVAPWVQVVCATLALVGIPVIVGAGVGALYRIESHLRVFLGYLAVCLLVMCFVELHLLVSGTFCTNAVNKDALRMGPAFMCGFVETFLFFWMLLAGLCQIYFMYVVWSAAEEISQTTYPELMRYSNALKAIKPPEPSQGPFPVGARPSTAFPYAAPAPGTPLLAFSPGPGPEASRKKPSMASGAMAAEAPLVPAQVLQSSPQQYLQQYGGPAQVNYGSGAQVPQQPGFVGSYAGVPSYGVPTGSLVGTPQSFAPTPASGVSDPRL